MRSLRRTATLLIIATGALASTEADAQARGRPATESRQQARLSDAPAANRAQQLADLNAWLGRLVGRFRARSSFPINDMGVMDMGSGAARLPDPPQQFFVNCTSVGAGSGVICLYEAMDATVYELPLAYLMGVDADQLGIRILQLDDKGYASAKFGQLRGDTVIFESDCPAAGNCRGRSIMRVRAPPRSRTIEIFREADVKLPNGSTRAPQIQSRTELRRE